ncbi:hypothetical protein [Gordonia rhizosphera]|uniref:Uncharacterized protein n=1 Tax=Gordonia rhizosphera NBRC 16068 TaxID=1108045 RepID=K6VB65_9ACTN|nr:hypothetical protein [Gordonia rhizosphera]GAB93453.1 hypothetical protein GORHZ_222_00080 [Gordonia rhizosphera NBRC 16068]
MAENVVLIILAIVGGTLTLLGLFAIVVWIREWADLLGPLLAGAGLIAAVVGFISGAATWVIVASIVALVVGVLLRVVAEPWQNW